MRLTWSCSCISFRLLRRYVVVHANANFLQTEKLPWKVTSFYWFQHHAFASSTFCFSFSFVKFMDKFTSLSSGKPVACFVHWWGLAQLWIWPFLRVNTLKLMSLITASILESVRRAWSRVVKIARTFEIFEECSRMTNAKFIWKSKWNFVLSFRCFALFFSFDQNSGP